jgi:hypothetical protein
MIAKINVFDSDNDSIMIAECIHKETFKHKDIGIVLLPSKAYAAVMLRFGLIFKDTVTSDFDKSLKAFRLISNTVRHLDLVGAEIGAANYFDTIDIPYPLNPDYL